MPVANVDDLYVMARCARALRAKGRTRAAEKVDAAIERLWGIRCASQLRDPAEAPSPTAGAAASTAVPTPA